MCLFAVCQFCTILSACDDDLEIDTAQQLVIEGYAEAGSCPVVFLTSSIRVSTEYVSIDSLSSHLLRHANVVLDDGEQKIYMTGRYRKNSYTFPFEYTTGSVVCQENRTYRISVDYEDMHAEAITTVPKLKCHIQEVCPVFVNDTLFKIVVVPQENESLEKVRFFVRCRYSGGEFMLARTSRGENNAMEIFCPILQGVDISHHYFSIEEDVILRCSTFDEVGLRFWDSYNELLSMSRLFFLPVADNIDSNVQGGLGAWCGCQSEYYPIEAKTSSPVSIP